MTKRAWMVVGMVAGMAACGEEAGTNASSQTVEPVGMVSLAPSTHAGVASDRNTYVALVVSGTEVTAYACDGRVGSWFRGSAFSLPATLRASDGRELTLDRLGGRYEGTIRREGAEALTFVLDEMRGEALFRAEAHEAGASWLGGWVVLPDGTQRGLVANTAGVTCSPPLNALERSLDVRSCTPDVPPLVPAPFSPASLSAPTANVRPTFLLAAFGDSYASGEGAPTTPGRHTMSGAPESEGAIEDWGFAQPTGLASPVTPTAEQRAVARACHRSDAAGSAVARQLLQQRFPNVNIAHVSFACSGATTEQIFRAEDSGHAGCDERTNMADRERCRRESDEGAMAVPVPSQLAQYGFFRDRFRLKADAAYLSIGGNDLGFGKIITDCVTPFSHCDDAESTSRAVLADGLTRVRENYARVATNLRAAGITPDRTFITLYPSPLSRTRDADCNVADYTLLGDLLLREIDDDEDRFANETLATINREVSAAATSAQWNVIDSLLDGARGHGMCAEVPFFNSLPAALRTQGRDMPEGEIVFTLNGQERVLPILSISSGMVHPNARGHAELYAPAIADAVTPLVRRRFTPVAPSRPRIIAQAAGSVTVAWTDNSSIEDRYEVTATPVDGGTAQTQRLAADAQTLRLTGLGTRTHRVSIRACFDAGSNSLNCSEPVTLDVAARVPTAAPADLSTATEPATTIGWSRSRDPSHVYYAVDFDLGPDMSTDLPALIFTGGPARRVRVASCSLLGCGPATAFVPVPVREGVTVCPSGQVRNTSGLCVPDTRPAAQPGRLPGV